MWPAASVRSAQSQRARHTRDFVRSDLCVVSGKNRGAFRTGSRFGFPRYRKCADISVELLQDSGTYAGASRTRLLHFSVRLQKGSFALRRGRAAEAAVSGCLIRSDSRFLLSFRLSERLTYEFHRDSVLEIMRVTRGEARIYPTVTFEAQPSEYVPMLCSDPALQRFEFTEIKTDFEFVVNSNSFLRVRRRT
jgi:hypothetical protein